MSNGSSDLSKYFPAGSAVIQRVDNLRQRGSLTDNSLILTKKEFDTAMAKADKKAKLYFIYGLIIGIIGIIVSVTL